jgi:hypothetical protein
VDGTPLIGAAAKARVLLRLFSVVHADVQDAACGSSSRGGGSASSSSALTPSLALTLESLQEDVASVAKEKAPDLAAAIRVTAGRSRGSGGAPVVTY